MRTFVRSTVLLLLTIMSGTELTAQKNSKTNLFSSFPEKISISESFLSQCFQHNEGSRVNLSLAEKFNMNGIVLSNEKAYHNLESIRIESPEVQCAILYISRYTADDKSTIYDGRLMGLDIADGYRIRRDEKGNYYLLKFQTADIIPSCDMSLNQ